MFIFVIKKKKFLSYSFVHVLNLERKKKKLVEQSDLY